MLPEERDRIPASDVHVRYLPRQVVLDLVSRESAVALARSIDTTRVSVDRSLRQFVRRGIIDVRDQGIVIRDRAFLRSISEE